MLVEPSDTASPCLQQFFQHLLPILESLFQAGRDEELLRQIA